MYVHNVQCTWWARCWESGGCLAINIPAAHIISFRRHHCHHHHQNHQTWFLVASSNCFSLLCDIVQFLLSAFLCICIISVFVYLNFEMVKMQREQGLSVTHVRPPLPLRHMTLARPNPCVKPCPACPDAKMLMLNVSHSHANSAPMHFSLAPSLLHKPTICVQPILGSELYILIFYFHNLIFLYFHIFEFF